MECSGPSLTPDLTQGVDFDKRAGMIRATILSAGTCLLMMSGCAPSEVQSHRFVDAGCPDFTGEYLLENVPSTFLNGTDPELKVTVRSSIKQNGCADLEMAFHDISAPAKRTIEKLTLNRECIESGDWTRCTRAWFQGGDLKVEQYVRGSRSDRYEMMDQITYRLDADRNLLMEILRAARFSDNGKDEVVRLIGRR